MHKKLIKNINEYKNYVFSQLEKWEWDLNILYDKKLKKHVPQYITIRGQQ
jgi:hypothetical protein